MNILCVHETKWKGQKATEVEDNSFKLRYIGMTTYRNGVGIVIGKSLRDEVVDIKRQRDRIILVKLVVGDLVFNIISVYAPRVGLDESVKRLLWEELDSVVNDMPIGEKFFIRGCLNCHVDSSRVGFVGAHGYRL